MLIGSEIVRTATIAIMLLASAPVSASADPLPARIADAILAALVESSGVPGMGAAISQYGEMVWIGSAGLRDVEAGLPVMPDTRFRFASVSKLFTVTAAARLREQGKLDADAPISLTLPYLSPHWPPITTAQLAAHTAGVPHYQPIDDRRGAKHFDTVEDAALQVVGRRLLTPPGAAYSYSSWGYVLLSAVVEARAGKPFLEVLAHEITPDLAIGPDATGSNDVQASKAYDFVDHRALEASAHDFSYTWGGGGLGGTAPALARFGGRVLDGGVVSPATLEWMQTPARLNDGALVSERDYTVGFGWRRSTDSAGRRVLHHAGSAIGARSALLLYPEQSTAVALLANAGWTSAIEQSVQMLAAPFLRPAPGMEAKPCPVQTTSVQVWEDGNSSHAATGPAQFARLNGVCTGSIPVPARLAARLADFPQRSAAYLTIIGIDLSGGLKRGTLVTPMGAYALTLAKDGRYGVRFDEKRQMMLQFD